MLTGKERTILNAVRSRQGDGLNQLAFQRLSALLITNRKRRMPHDFNRPFVAVSEMESYFALQREIAVRYGQVVKAVQISNREYEYRHTKLSAKQKMKAPPGSVIHICSGYLVVKKLGTTEQYETWMPDAVFEEMYARENPID